MAKEYKYDEEHVAYQQKEDMDRWGGVLLLMAIALLFVLAIYLW